ncbi:DUF2254 family protein [Arthrobacter sp. KFRI-F3372]|uniref:DUF2254 family protein n=2 Tax=Micrococcaceae TaxID=1268 RepID=UPI0027A99975|nr:DUF2254 family protein [Arthrobacter oryzae]WHP61068.1 DUF2254 family protein [Arthrobacter sp. KFRI-F3372]
MTFTPAVLETAVETGYERTNVQDVGFGFRQLVDVAVRALSPGVNDPTTAVHVIGHLSVLLAGWRSGPRARTSSGTRPGRYVWCWPFLSSVTSSI